MKCTYIKSDNTQCKANAVFHSDFCWNHNPDIPDEVKFAASSKGGRQNSHSCSPEDVVMPLPENKSRKDAGPCCSD